MTNSRPRPLWAGRALALVGIILVALSLRTAVAALSPIIDHISGEIPFDNLALAIVGSAPPIAFAVAGLLSPLLARRVGLERAMLIAVVRHGARTPRAGPRPERDPVGGRNDRHPARRRNRQRAAAAGRQTVLPGPGRTRDRDLRDDPLAQHRGARTRRGSGRRRGRLAGVARRVVPAGRDGGDPVDPAGDSGPQPPAPSAAATDPSRPSGTTTPSRPGRSRSRMRRQPARRPPSVMPERRPTRARASAPGCCARARRGR